MSSPFVYAKLYNASGVLVGDVTPRSFSVTKQLHGIGTGELSIPLTDATHKSQFDSAYRVVLFGGYGDNEAVQIYDGVINDSSYGLADSQPVLQFTIDDRLVELFFLQTRVGQGWNNVDATTVIANILGYTSENTSGTWSSAFSNSTLISHKSSGGTVWDLLQVIAGNLGLSVRNTGTVISIGEFGTVADCELTAGDVQTPVTGNGKLFSVLDLQTRTNTRDIINRLYAFMRGSGNPAQDGLNRATQQPRYGLRVSGSDPNLIYIEDTDSQASYGLRVSSKTYDWIIPLSQTTVGLQQAADMLYREACEDLDHYKTPQTTYEVKVAGADVWDLPFTVGDKVPLRVEFPNGAITAIAANLWVQSITWQWSSGEQPALLLSLTTINRPDKNGLTRAADAIGGLKEETKAAKARSTARTFPEVTTPITPEPSPEVTPTEPTPPNPEPPPTTVSPSVPSDSKCAMAVGLQGEFYDVLTAANTLIGSASSKGGMIADLRTQAELDNLGTLSATDFTALFALASNTATITTDLADTTYSDEFRTWLYCLGVPVAPSVISAWIENESTWPTELKSLGTILARAISEQAWAWWRSAYSVDTDASTCSAYVCDEALQKDRVFVLSDGMIQRNISLTFETPANWVNVSPATLTGMVMDFVRDGISAYLITYSAADDESTLWFTNDVMNVPVVWNDKQTVSGRYTRIALSSTSGAGWMYAPNAGWMYKWDFTVTSGAGDGWFANPNNTGSGSGAQGSWSSGNGWVTSDRRETDGEYSRTVNIQNNSIGGLDLNAVSTTRSFTKGSYYGSTGSNEAKALRADSNALTTTFNASVNMTDVTEYLYFASEPIAAVTSRLRSSLQLSASYSGAGTVKDFTIYGFGATPTPTFTQGALSSIALTRYFTSNGDTLADEVIVGTGYSDETALGALSANGTTVFAAASDKVRNATSGGTYADYQTIANATDIVATSSSAAWYGNSTLVYEDGTNRTPIDSGNNGDPVGNRWLSIASTRTFALCDFLGTPKLAYWDGASWSFETVDTASLAIASIDTDKVYVLDTANIQYGDVAGTLTDYATPNALGKALFAG
jgi:hypothetical protein